MGFKRNRLVCEVDSNPPSPLGSGGSGWPPVFCVTRDRAMGLGGIEGTKINQSGRSGCAFFSTAPFEGYALVPSGLDGPLLFVSVPIVLHRRTRWGGVGLTKKSARLEKQEGAGSQTPPPRWGGIDPNPPPILLAIGFHSRNWGRGHLD